ncbi:beta galactosidase jelly roll domain-containing protein [Mucilaginibacter sp. SP1R1]|uniref:beta galactosidase jelly roll domain-containing protein n=1 Tax=Mucilaginibacter sp. SP1R1 TaxID=2723091 RepID=UPI0017AA1B9A|nr:beta galactosidase jelly roll domain-containing protein [Mucilaginibacter sp. SP1R1]MBB6150005.1 hypothetical protein [Mucilaginibacter sp. SP1R1]
MQIIADRKTLANDGWDAMPITIQVLDSKGRPVPTANIPVDFEISGGGRIIGLGNGDPNSHEAEKGNRRSLFNGLAQLIVQSNEGEHAPIKLVAKSAGMKDATILIPLHAVTPRTFVQVLQSVMVLEQWRASAISKVRPDPNQKIDDNDMNSWFPVTPGQLQDMTGGRYIIYRTTFKPYDSQQKNGGRLIFQKVTGKAELWIDGKMIGARNNAVTADWTVNLPAGSRDRVISVLIEAESGSKAGLGGVVSIETDQ